MCISSYDFPENNFLSLDKIQLDAQTTHAEQPELGEDEAREKQARTHQVGGRSKQEEEGGFLPSFIH